MDTYHSLKEQFKINGDPEKAVIMAAYMRNLFLFYGLPTPKRKALYKEFLKAEKQKTKSIGICWMHVMPMNIENFSIL